MFADLWNLDGHHIARIKINPDEPLPRVVIFNGRAFVLEADAGYLEATTKTVRELKEAMP